MTIEIPAGRGSYTIDDHDQIYVLRAGARHKVGGNNSVIVATDESANDKIVIQGGIISSLSAINNTGVAGATLTITNDGLIRGQYALLLVSFTTSTTDTVVNHGVMDGKQHWAMDHGDLVITLGHDELILAGVTKSDVHDTDFVFAG